MMPAAFSGAMNFAGLPADVVTNLTPELQTNFSIASSRRNRIGRVTPNGRLPGLILLITSWNAQGSPDTGYIIDSPPVRHNAETCLVRSMPHPWVFPFRKL